MALMGREIFEPGSTGNKAAEELAKAWIATAEQARKLFNAAVVLFQNLKNGIYHKFTTRF